MESSESSEHSEDEMATTSQEQIEIENPKTGYEKWCEEYAQELIEPTDLLAQINTVMEAYDNKQTKMRADDVAVYNAGPDEEGWIKVTRKSKSSFKRTAKVDETLRKKKRKFEAGTENFYKFQSQDTKLSRLNELRRKFEEDKKRLAALRSRSKFKPE